MRHYRIGDIDIAVAIHGRGTGSPRWMFPDIAADELSDAIAPYVDDHGNIEFVYSSLIVSFGDHVVLLDAGPAPVAGSRASSIADALDEAGFSPRDIDTVVITHGHDDHVGGLTTTDATGPALSFPNALHHAATAEFRHWTTGTGRGQMASEKLTQLDDAGALTLVDGRRDVAPGVSVLPSPGHTPGHLSVVISSRQDHALYVGDAFAHQVNVPHPAWNHFSDMLPGPARQSREDLVELGASGHHLILAAHVPIAGRIQSTRAGRRLTPVEPVPA